jgi:hypothetical protein
VRRRAGVALAAGCFALAASSCRQIGGVHARESLSAQCASCQSGACAADEAACRTAGACASRLDCARACDVDDTACRAACAVHAAGTAGGATDAIARFEACGETTCGASCASACGDVLPIAPPESAAACAACVAKACCAEASACGTNAECRAGLECARAASASDVVHTCPDVKHAAGADAFHALDACVKDSCPDDCAYGGDWSCVGSVAVPQPQADTVTGTITIVDAANQSKPVAGLSVRGCFVLNESCDQAGSPVLTDANGNATLTLPTLAQSGRLGFQGFFEITDPSTPPTYLPALAFPNVAVTQDGFTQRIIATTPAALQQIADVAGVF